MAIAIRCAECGRAYDLNDTLAGSELQCVECGRMMNIPGTPLRPKVCTVCNKDVAGVPRFKDQDGYYYCEYCWAQTRAALAELDPDALALREEILRQRRWDNSPRPGRPGQSEFVKLVHLVFNTPRTRRFKQRLLVAWLVLSAASVFVAQVALLMWATMLVMGAFILSFTIFWTYAPPFMDGGRNGFACLISHYRGVLWKEKNRDYRLRWPGWTVLQGICLLIGAWAYFALAWRLGRAPDIVPDWFSETVFLIQGLAR